MKTRYLLLFLFSLVLSASGLAGLPPIDRDEARFVQSTKQMVETGDYVDIRLQETTRYKKPIGIYWLQSAAVQLSGQGLKRRSSSTASSPPSAWRLPWSRSPGPAPACSGAAGLAAGLVMAAVFATAFEGGLPRPTRCCSPARCWRRARWRKSTWPPAGTSRRSPGLSGCSGSRRASASSSRDR